MNDYSYLFFAVEFIHQVVFFFAFFIPFINLLIFIFSNWQVQIPSENSQYNVTSLLSSASVPDVVPSLHLNNLYGCLGDCVYQVHVLWELVLIGEPVVVMAWSPEVCSQLVQALVSLILPLR